LDRLDKFSHRLSGRRAPSRVAAAALLSIRAVALAASLVFVSVSFRWDSQHLLPWSVRFGGTLAVLLAAVVLARACWWGDLVDRLRRIVEHRSGWLWATALSLVAAGGSAALTYAVLDPIPHIEDETAYLFQAKVFANGRLYAPAPALPEFFPSSWIITHQDRWFAVFPPGWPLLLAVGTKAGTPALVNPILTGLCVLVLFGLLREASERTAAAYGTALSVASPFFLFMGASFMSHTAMLLFASLSTLCHLKALRRDGSRGWFLLAGLSSGMAVLIRPPDAVALWCAQGLYGVVTARGRRLRVAAGLVLSAIGLLPGALLYLSYNRVLTGSWFFTPLALISPNLGLGFGPRMGANWDTFETPGHDLWRALLNLNFNSSVLSQDLFGWPMSSLILLLVLWTFSGRRARGVGLASLAVASIVGGYAGYWYHGVCFGARFYFGLMPYLVLLTVAGARALPGLLESRFRPPARMSFVHLTAAAVVLSSVFGWVIYVPKVSLLGPYYNQRGINAGLHDFAARERLDSTIVFVRAPRVDLFGPGLVANSLPLGSGTVIYAFDRGPANERLVAQFPDRSVREFSYFPERNLHEIRFRRLVRSVKNRLGLGRTAGPDGHVDATS
jgi:hypothetical protein